MAPLTSKQLLVKLIDLARNEAIVHQQDFRDKIPRRDMGEKGVFFLLDLCDHAGRGGRFVGEPKDAPGVNNATQEGEYKFWDQQQHRTFFKINGNPTAARALLLQLTGNEDIRKTPTVWMAFIGSIEDSLGPAAPRPVPLQSILSPLKFWDRLPELWPHSDEILQTKEGALNADCCKPFWNFAVEVIRNAPHMLKQDYLTRVGRGKEVRRFSWARLLVLLFTPEKVLIERLISAKVSVNLSREWYQQARQDMKELVTTKARGSVRNAIQQGWDGLCRELDEIYTYTFPIAPDLRIQLHYPAAPTSLPYRRQLQQPSAVPTSSPSPNMKALQNLMAFSKFHSEHIGEPQDLPTTSSSSPEHSIQMRSPPYTPMTHPGSLGQLHTTEQSAQKRSMEDDNVNNVPHQAKKTKFKLGVSGHQIAGVELSANNDVVDSHQAAGKKNSLSEPKYGTLRDINDRTPLSDNDDDAIPASKTGKYKDKNGNKNGAASLEEPNLAAVDKKGKAGGARRANLL